MARLPRLMGRGARPWKCFSVQTDIRGDEAEFLGYVNRSMPDAELDNFVDALATRIASFDKWAIANTKRLVNAASFAARRRDRSRVGCLPYNRSCDPAAQERIKALFETGFSTSPEMQKIDWDSTWGNLGR